MGEAIIVAIITSGVSLLGTVITVIMASRKTDENLKVSQAVTDTEIKELTREVREHNGYARRMPVLEEKVENLTHRVCDLEQKMG